MDTSLFCFASDLAGAGVPEVFAAVRAAGADGITLATAYHAASDHLPHNPRFRVHHTPPGVCFRAEADRYPATVPPPPMLPVCQGRDLLAEAIEHAATVSMSVRAWLVYLHRDGDDDAGSTVENAFGDRHPALLCPAAPASQDYAAALTADVCRYNVAGIVAEALHYLPMEHGYHHERSFAELDDLASFLLSLCFCQWCVAAARDAGIDADRLRAWSRSTIDAPEGTAPALASFGEGCDGQLGRYLELRQDHVTAITARCAKAAGAAGVDFTFIDLSAAMSAGPGPRPYGPELAWRLGVDVTRIAASSNIMLAGYSPDPQRVAEEIAAYQAAALDRQLDIVLRPMPPDCDSAENFAAKLDAARKAGVRHAGYYHYGLMPQSSLDMLASLTVRGS